MNSGQYQPTIYQALLDEHAKTQKKYDFLDGLLNGRKSAAGKSIIRQLLKLDGLLNLQQFKLEQLRTKIFNKLKKYKRMQAKYNQLVAEYNYSFQKQYNETSTKTVATGCATLFYQTHKTPIFFNDDAKLRKLREKFQDLDRQLEILKDYLSAYTNSSPNSPSFLPRIQNIFNNNTPVVRVNSSLV